MPQKRIAGDRRPVAGLLPHRGQVWRPVCAPPGERARGGEGGNRRRCATCSLATPTACWRRCSSPRPATRSTRSSSARPSGSPPRWSAPATIPYRSPRSSSPRCYRPGPQALGQHGGETWRCREDGQRRILARIRGFPRRLAFGSHSATELLWTEARKAYGAKTSSTGFSESDERQLPGVELGVVVTPDGAQARDRGGVDAIRLPFCSGRQKCGANWSSRSVPKRSASTAPSVCYRRPWRGSCPRYRLGAREPSVAWRKIARLWRELTKPNWQ